MKTLLHFVMSAFVIVLFSTGQALAADEMDAGISQSIAESVKYGAYTALDSNNAFLNSAIAAWNNVSGTLTAAQQIPLLDELSAAISAGSSMAAIISDGNALMANGYAAMAAYDWNLAVDKFSAACIKYDEAYGPGNTMQNAITNFFTILGTY